MTSKANYDKVRELAKDYYSADVEVLLDADMNPNDSHIDFWFGAAVRCRMWNLGREVIHDPKNPKVYQYIETDLHSDAEELGDAICHFLRLKLEALSKKFPEVKESEEYANIEMFADSMEV